MTSFWLWSFLTSLSPCLSQCFLFLLSLFPISLLVFRSYLPSSSTECYLISGLKPTSEISMSRTLPLSFHLLSIASRTAHRGVYIIIKHLDRFATDIREHCWFSFWCEEATVVPWKFTGFVLDERLGLSESLIFRVCAGKQLSAAMFQQVSGSRYETRIYWGSW